MVPLTAYMKDYPDIPDLGLGCLAKALRNAGFGVDVLGWNHRLRPDEFRQYLRNQIPVVVGLKVFTHNMKAALKTVATIKSVDPSIIVVIGGPHPSANDAGETMEDFRQADFGFQGDAERGLVALLSEISNSGFNNWQDNLDSRRLNQIAGLIWRQDGKVHSNPPDFPEDLDTFGIPSWDLIDPRDYHFYSIDETERQGYIAPLMVTRGCPLSCTFCSVASVNGSRIRRRSIPSLLDELNQLYNHYGVRQLTIMDTSFLSDKEYVKEFCNRLIEKGLHFKWDCICDTLTRRFYNDQILRLMHQAGCRRIIMGIESGSNRILKVIKKTWDKAQFRQIASLIKGHGIQIHGYFMFGFPQETEKDMQKTRDFAFRMGFDKVFFNVCYPLPGTEIYNYLKHRYQIQRLDWKNFSVETSSYPLSEVTTRRIMAFFYQTELLNLLRTFSIPRDLFAPRAIKNLGKSLAKLILFYLFGIARKLKQV
jgi:radical SAM superfamily enzyme YgiQ (UPF0313 family)